MTGNAQAGSRLLGTLRSADGKGVVRMENRLGASIDDAWSAITDPVRLAGGNLHRVLDARGARLQAGQLTPAEGSRSASLLIAETLTRPGVRKSPR